MDLAAPIDRITKLATDAEQARVAATFKVEEKALANDPYRYVLRLGDKLEERDKPLPPYGCTIDSLEDLIALSRRQPADTTIWHNAQQVVIQRSDSPRMAYGTFNFKNSDAFNIVTGLRSAKYHQKQFIQLLRSELPDVVMQADVLVSVLRQVKFATHSEATGVVNLGRESMGRSVDAEVSGAGALPETAVLIVAQFDNAQPIDTAIKVDADLDVDLAEQTFALRPIAAQLVAERHRVEQAIHDWLYKQANEPVKGEERPEIPVYRGAFHFAECGDY